MDINMINSFLNLNWLNFTDNEMSSSKKSRKRTRNPTKHKDYEKKPESAKRRTTHN